MESQQRLLNTNDTSMATTRVSVTKSTDETKEATYNLCFMIRLVSIAALGGFLFGYDTGVIAGAQLYFSDDWPDITDSQIALIVSIALIGAAIGSLFSGSISDRIGRW